MVSLAVTINNINPATFNVTAGTEYVMTFKNGYDLTVLNNSDGELYLSSEDSFEMNENVGNFYTIPAMSSVVNYKRYIHKKSDLYLYAVGVGTVTIIQN